MAQEGKQQGQGKQEMAAPSERGQVARVTPRGLSPFEEMDRMFDQMFEGFFPRGWMRPYRWERPGLVEAAAEVRVPRVDVVDRDDDILLRAEIPGIKKENLEITTTENTVTIKGSSKYEEKEEKGEYYRREISHGTFTRTVALPSNIDATNAKAKFQEGVLELTLPKIEKAKRHTIPVE